MLLGLIVIVPYLAPIKKSRKIKIRSYPIFRGCLAGLTKPDRTVTNKADPLAGAIRDLYPENNLKFDEPA